ncbi:hypothetical protein P3H15_32765 [Rhodococcus sp. T2V]|uniref:hypothetical protein n=1 Tax=Rhodococcus sp. T2V TaxID=3034164 RepID=UPI0023E11C61|nr:hypothetical protein [Rhodococcus sp. T2V]MDF3309793.1 hypothetical protein [Rhodococcus sp. T2V]
MTETKLDPDYYTAARDGAGNIRLNRGSGLLVADADATREEVQRWYEQAQRSVAANRDHWIRQYKAALELIDSEAGR